MEIQQPQADRRQPPNRHKLVLVTWLGTYPAITTAVWLLLPALLEHLPLPVTTLVLSAVVVPFVSYVAQPLLQRALAPWLEREAAPRPEPAQRSTPEPVDQPVPEPAAQQQMVPATQP